MSDKPVNETGALSSLITYHFPSALSTSHYRFATINSVINCRMCFTSNGSVTPWRDFA